LLTSAPYDPVVAIPPTCVMGAKKEKETNEIKGKMEGTGRRTCLYNLRYFTSMRGFAPWSWLLGPLY